MVIPSFSGNFGWVVLLCWLCRHDSQYISLSIAWLEFACCMSFDTFVTHFLFLMNIFSVHFLRMFDDFTIRLRQCFAFVSLSFHFLCGFFRIYFVIFSGFGMVGEHTENLHHCIFVIIWKIVESKSKMTRWRVSKELKVGRRVWVKIEHFQVFDTKYIASKCLKRGKIGKNLAKMRKLAKNLKRATAEIIRESFVHILVKLAAQRSFVD